MGLSFVPWLALVAAITITRSDGAARKNCYICDNVCAETIETAEYECNAEHNMARCNDGCYTELTCDTGHSGDVCVTKGCTDANNICIRPSNFYPVVPVVTSPGEAECAVTEFCTGRYCNAFSANRLSEMRDECCPECHGSGWSYHGINGPAHWPGICASGTFQSPIDIEEDDTVHDDDLDEFQLNGYDTATGEFTISNNGHTVVVDVPGNTYSVSGGGLDGSYNLAQFHFHWGSSNDKGSEHTVDSAAYPMEVHFVHYADEYDGVGAAVEANDPNGLAVLGFFFEIGANENAVFNNIINELGHVTYKEQSSSMAAFPLGDLLPSEINRYYRYAGGLTTPTCNEVVVWTVFDQTIQISQAQMDAFRDLKENLEDHDDVELVDNFRPVQPLNGRTVYRSWAETTA